MGDYELEVHSVNITIAPSSNTLYHETTDNASGSTGLATSTILAQDFLQEQGQASDLPPPIKEEAQQLMGDSVASPTIISRIIDRIVDNLKVTITQLNIKVVCAPSLPSLNLLVPSISISNEDPVRQDEHVSTSESRTKKLLISGLEINLRPAVSNDDSRTSSSASSTSSRQYASAIEQSVYLDATEDLASTMASMLMQQPSSVRRIASILGRSISATIKLCSSPLHPSSQSSRDVYSIAAYVTQNVTIDLGNVCINLSPKDILDLSHILSMLVPSSTNDSDAKVPTSKPLESSVSTIQTINTDKAADGFDLPGMYRSTILQPVIGEDTSPPTKSDLPPEQLSILNPADVLKLHIQLSSLSIIIFYHDSFIDRNSFLHNDSLHHTDNTSPYLYTEALSMSVDVEIDYQDNTANSVSLTLGAIALMEKSAETSETILQCGPPTTTVHSNTTNTPALSISMLLKDSAVETDIALQHITVTLSLELLHRLYTLFASMQPSSATSSSVIVTMDKPSDSLSESQQSLYSYKDDGDEDSADGRGPRSSRIGMVCPSVTLGIASSDSSKLQFRLLNVTLQQDQSSQHTLASVTEITAHLEQDATTLQLLVLKGKEKEDAFSVKLGPSTVNISCQILNLYLNSTIYRTILVFAKDAETTMSPSNPHPSQIPTTPTSTPTTSNVIIAAQMKSCSVELDMGSSIAALSLIDIDVETVPSTSPSIQLMIGSIHGTMQMGQQTYVFISSMELRSHTNTKVLELKVIQQNVQERIVQVQLENLNIYYHQEQLPAWIAGLTSLLQTSYDVVEPAKKQPITGANGHISTPILITEILISDCSVKIIPQGLNTRAVLLLQYAEIELSPRETQIDVRASATSIFGLIIDDTVNQKHSDASKTRQDALTYWQACGYVTLLSIKDGSAAACIVSDPSLDVQISLAARKVQFDACADSLQTFLATVSAVVPVPEEMPSAGNDVHQQIRVDTSDHTFDDDVFRSDARFTAGKDVAKDTNSLSFVEGFFSVDRKYSSLAV